jgi:bacterioferritin-associated ferredoxin
VPAEPGEEGPAVVVCHCRVIDDRTIGHAIRCGARDVDQVVELCGAGEACGGCVPGIEELLADAEAAITSPDLLARRQAVRRGRRRDTAPAVA